MTTIHIEHAIIVVGDATEILEKSQAQSNGKARLYPASRAGSPSPLAGQPQGPNPAKSKRFTKDVVGEARKMRREEGLTYREIAKRLPGLPHMTTVGTWCKGVKPRKVEK